MAMTGFAGNGVRPTTQAEILVAIRNKIRLNVPAFDQEPTCFISGTPFPSVELQDNLFCTISPTDGAFDVSLMDGGGAGQVCEQATFSVSVWTHIMVDQIERYEEGFVDPDRGLLSLKLLILKALAGRNLDGGNDTLLLMESLNPGRCRFDVQNKEDDEFAGLIMTFEGKWWWDLDGESGPLT